MKQQKKKEAEEKEVNLEKVGEPKVEVEDLKAIRRYIG